MMNNRILLTILFCFIAVAGCQKTGVGPENKTASQLTADGWNAFAGSSYQAALTNFNNAINEDVNFVDAYNGAGWANAKLNSPQAAITNFTKGILKDTLSLDSLDLEMNAGLAFAYNAQKNYAQSIS